MEPFGIHLPCSGSRGVLQQLQYVMEPIKLPEEHHQVILLTVFVIQGGADQSKATTAFFDISSDL